MGEAKNYIVFLCYGYERVFYECAYSLLSLSRVYAPDQLSNTEVWIYTDKPEWFDRFHDCALDLNFRKLGDATLAAWRGKTGFVHRVKIEVLKDLTSKKAGNILYVDTDSVFTHNIDKILQDIGAGRLYMHTMEGVVNKEGTPLLKKLNRYLQKDKKQTAGKTLQAMSMWNAGVIGFNTDHKNLLDEALAFTDDMYPEFPKHIVEQFAFSVCFQRAGEIKAVAPYVFHYWKLKEAGVVWASFFEYFKEASWGRLVQYSMLVQIHALMQEKADFFHNRTFAESILNRQWKPLKPDWAELVKQL